MKIGTLDGSMNLPWEKLFDGAAKLGFAGVELGVAKDYHQTKLWNAAGRKELAELSRSSGVAVASICLHSYWNFSFASPDSDIRKKAANIATEAASIAAELGARNILVPITHVKDVPLDEARERWVSGIKSVASAAEKSGVIFALENVGQPFAYRAPQIADIIDEIGSKAVKSYYDPGNSIWKEIDPVGEILHLKHRISQVHIKEVHGKLLGEGKVPLKEVMGALKQIGYDGWLIFETDATDDPPKAQAANLDYLKKLL